MTMMPIGPDKALDPAMLAARVPLRRVGTQEASQRLAHRS